MKVSFNQWSADEIIQAYIDFIKKRNNKEVFIKYLSNKYGFKETMEGRLEIDDKRLKDLPTKVQYSETAHHLKLFQKNWKIKFQLLVVKDCENEYLDTAELSFDNSLHKEVYLHFKEFGPKKIK